MNNEKPVRPEQPDIDREGAGKGVVLLCCTLFLLFQALVFLSGFSQPSSDLLQLEVAVSDSLALVVADQSENQPQSLSRTHHRFSPFFFEPIAINFCDRALLMSVRGIGPSLAEAIIRTREEEGVFKRAEDLLEVKGIGMSRMQSFSQFFDFSADGQHN